MPRVGPLMVLFRLVPRMRQAPDRDRSRRGRAPCYPLDRYSYLTASAVVRMRMTMPAQPASPPLDNLQSLTPSSWQCQHDVVAPVLEPLPHYGIGLLQPNPRR
uniref:Uncharacterized protein n=1 Tax=Knipowitschia caucasica TaxID=637954 RepID=A0AAV2IXJ6_KNICA